MIERHKDLLASVVLAVCVPGIVINIFYRGAEMGAGYCLIGLVLMYASGILSMSFYSDFKKKRFRAGLEAE